MFVARCGSTSQGQEDQSSREFKISLGLYIKIEASLGYMTLCMKKKKKKKTPSKAKKMRTFFPEKLRPDKIQLHERPSAWEVKRTGQVFLVFGPQLF